METGRIERRLRAADQAGWAAKSRPPRLEHKHERAQEGPSNKSSKPTPSVYRPAPPTTLPGLLLPPAPPPPPPSTVACACAWGWVGVRGWGGWGEGPEGARVHSGVVAGRRCCAWSADSPPHAELTGDGAPGGPGDLLARAQPRHDAAGGGAAARRSGCIGDGHVARLRRAFGGIWLDQCGGDRAAGQRGEAAMAPPGLRTATAPLQHTCRRSLRTATGAGRGRTARPRRGWRGPRPASAAPAPAASRGQRRSRGGSGAAGPLLCAGSGWRGARHAELARMASGGP